MDGPFILLLFLGIFIHEWQAFVSELLYLHKTFTSCMSYQYAHFGLSTCQMWLQVILLDTTI